jgi:large subunit ribosomal protein L25
MNQFEVTAEVRQDLGKGASRRLRHAGKVPAIVYGAGKEATSLTLRHSEMLRHLENEAFYSHILSLKIGDQVEQVVLKDLQRHPAKPIIMHADFMRVSETEKITMHVPLHFLNETACVGVKQGGGVVSHQMVELEIRCLPKDLPEFISVDLLNLQLGQMIHLSELQLPAGVEIPALIHGTEHDLPVVTIHKGHGGATAIEDETPAEGAE